MGVARRRWTVASIVLVSLAGCGDDAPVPVPSPAVSSSGTGETDGPQPDTTTGSSITITDLRITDAVDPSTGKPAPAREDFDADDDVILWFSFENGDAADSVTVAWFTEGDEVHSSTAALPSGANSMNFTLPRVIAGPGDYRFEVRQGTTVLADGTFRIAGES